MLPPDYITDSIDSDLQAYTWSKHLTVDPEEFGTAARFRRWMKKGAQYGSRIKQLGLGVFPWHHHAKSLRARWIFRYLDPSTGDYKFLLDQWLDPSSVEH